MIREANRKLRKAVIIAIAAAVAFELLNRNNVRKQEADGYQTSEFDDMW